jgi:hypothetical protein
MWKWWRTSQGYCTLCALAAIAAFLYMAFSIEPRLEVAMPQYQQNGTKNAADQQTNQGPNHNQHRETFWEWTTKDAAGFYTLLLAGVTVILAIVAGVQAVMFFWQLKLMREGINDAKTAADAAKTAAQSASTSADAQTQMAVEMVRPRIRVRQVSLDNPPDPLMPPQLIEGSFTAVNTGGTFANIVVWRCQVLLGTHRYPLWRSDVPQTIFEKDIPIHLSPGVHAEFRFKSDHNISASLAQSLFYGTGDATLYVIGRITYEDRAKITRITGFCRQWGTVHGEDRPRLYRFAAPDWDYED